jgi:xylulokinase
VTVLTLDLGTSATKAALWSGPERVESARVPIATTHPAPGHAEQEPEYWWRAVVDACCALRTAAPSLYAEVETFACSAARETFACFDGELRALSPGILWSDSRAADQLELLGDPAAFRSRTGVVLGAGCAAAKIAWVRQHEPAWFASARWLLAPRDLVVARLTGRVRTEPTVASRTGLYGLDGSFIGDEAVGQRLPVVASSFEATRLVYPNELELPEGATAILGAGDRCCEAIGVDASPMAPMVSWGTTVNVSVPTATPQSEVARHAQVSRAIGDTFLVEAGLSAAGAAMDWLASLTGWTRDALLSAAATVPPGARGALAFPWFHGARAPWWQPGAYGTFMGLTGAHGPPELARAIIEGIALDTTRSVELLAPDATTLQLVGAGAGDSLWRSVLAALASRPITIRRYDEAASVGARLLVAESRAEPMDTNHVNPVTAVEAPDPQLEQSYRVVRRTADRMAATLVATET